MLASELISYAMRIAGILGVGQSPLTQDIDDANKALAIMAAQWQRKRWLIFRIDAFSVPVTTHKATYTIGWGGDIDRPRPGAIESAFLRQNAGAHWDSFPVDFPLKQITSREGWNAIPLKKLGSWPSQWFYDPTIPLGTFYIWPVPIQHLFELHFSASQPIGNMPPDQELTFIMPPEAEEALAYNLAVRLRVNYGLPPAPGITILAAQTLNTLRTLNFRMRPLRMQMELRRNVRVRNPMGGFIPETVASVPFPVAA